MFWFLWKYSWDEKAMEMNSVSFQPLGIQAIAKRGQGEIENHVIFFWNQNILKSLCWNGARSGQDIVNILWLAFEIIWNAKRDVGEG